MKILTLEVEGYRSLKSLHWRPGDLNLMIGPNASGKSNLLRLLELLTAASQGSLGRLVQKEGGMEPMVWDGSSDQIRIAAKMTPLPPYSDPDTDALTYRLNLARLGRSSAYRVDHEVLGNFCQVENGQMQEPYKLLERTPQHAIVFSMDLQQFTTIPVTNTLDTPYPPVHPIEAPQSTLPEEETLLAFSSGPFSANRFAAEFQQEMASWQIHQGLQTQRDAPIRAPQVTRADTALDSDGQNLISVLHSLYSSNREFEEDVNMAMNAAFGDDFQKLTFPPAADQRIQMRIRWNHLKREQPAADLSDGTLRFLYLLAILANPSPPPLIAIDEPETGLHPSMMRIVAEYAQDAATRSQVFLTTHSPEFLDAFGDEVPTTTVVERTYGQTNLRIVSKDELSYWLKQYTLGQLFRSKELESMK